MAASQAEGMGPDACGNLNDGGKSGQQHMIGDSNEGVGDPTQSAEPGLSPEVEASPSEPELEAGDETERQLVVKIKAFRDQREEERKRMYHAMVWFSTRIFALGVTTSGVGNALRYALPESIVPGAIVILGFSTIMLAAVCGSCCPYDLLDLDTVFDKSPKTMVVLIFFISIVNVMQVRHFPHLDAVKVSCMLLPIVPLFMAACRLRLPRWWPTLTMASSWYMSVDGLSWAGIFFFHAQNDWLAIPEGASRVLAGINLAYGCTALAGWSWHRWHYADLGQGHSRRFYKVLYYWGVARGVRWLFYGIAWITSPREGFEDTVAGVLEVVRGLCTILPSATVVIVGRDRFFQTLGQAFDRDGARLRRDGAFVAELLESIPIQVGQTWWIHREVEQESYPPFDPRRCWQKGVVTQVANPNEFAVRIQDPRLSGMRTSIRRSFVSDSSNDAATVQVKLPTAGQTESKEELLLRAQRDLRCVEFENLSPDLMYRVDSRNKPELQAAWHSLSRPVRHGEKIDYFMSNSWYDNPETKWARLVEVAERFRRAHGRYPTFWLDKLCIDQQKITDGLKVLPVNVMACTKLLSLCGDTYLSRLWCIWELFTLFAFVSEAAALNRIEFVFLGTFEEGMAMLDSMANFHVNTAHCYDPNEEARLLQVIDAVGTARFNARVANMAEMTKARLVKLAKRGKVSHLDSNGGEVKATRSMSLSWGRNKSTASVRSIASDTGKASDTVRDVTDDGVQI